MIERKEVTDTRTEEHKVTETWCRLNEGKAAWIWSPSSGSFAGWFLT